MMLLSYFVGQKKFPIEYDLKSAFLYFGVATVLYVAGMALPIQSEWLRLGYRTILLGVFIAFMVKRDLPLRELPYVGRFFRLSVGSEGLDGVAIGIVITKSEPFV